MKLKLLALRLFLALSISSTFLLYRPLHERGKISVSDFTIASEDDEESEEEKEEAEKADYTAERWMHEFEMLRNPITGKIPEDYRQKELEAASKIPSRIKVHNPWMTDILGTEDVTVLNNYNSIGPNNIAGRSRTLAFDRRNPNIMISGGTTGGIFRSVDGGSSWTFVSPENDIRSVNTIVQSPTEPDTWYCGSGEVFYPTSAADIAGTFGFGVFKSSDNGVTWSKLNTTATGNQNRFDLPFDLVHRLAVHPKTGHIYAAIHNRIVRSVNGGQSWQTVLSSSSGNRALGGLTEIVIPSDGSRIYAAFTGENADRKIAGVWESATGDSLTANNNAWIRIAGGQSGQPDSVGGWQPYGKWGRIVMNMNGNNNQLFVLYKNGKDAEEGTPEADLFRANITLGSTDIFAWTNLSDYVPDEPNYEESGIDPYTTQFNGFNMSIAAKPDNDNILFIGGTNVHRVHLNETNPARKFRRIGGYARGFFSTGFFYPDHHPDIHGIYYAPGNNSTLYTADDGGIHKSRTTDIADTVRWTPHVAELQTMQYQFVNLIPDTAFNWMIGGAQDNGTTYNLDFPERSHKSIGSGDGAACAMSNFSKNGNTWTQQWYFSTSNGNISRSTFTWKYNTSTNKLDFVNNDLSDITPSGFSGSGQWLTLFLNDPDSSEHLYYTNRNKLFRTKNAPSVTNNVTTTVTPSSWTEMTGIGTSVPSGHDFSSIAISKLPHRSKYLFLGTNQGRVYRLDSAHKAASTQLPIDITPSQMINKSYVSGIAVNPRNPDSVLVVVSNYDDANNNIPNIFFTENATTDHPTWRVLDGALAPLSSQSCAIVVKTTGVEFYVGTSVGLYSTTAPNGNNTQWLKEGSGMMKTAIIRSLVNRPEDNSFLIGTHGNGAFLADIGNSVSYTSDIPEPPRNGNDFIVSLHPTQTTNIVRYRVGILPVTKITVQLFSVNGQEVYREDRAYQNNIIDMARYAAGVYIVRIISSDGKEKFVQRVVKR
ncbi:T9SS type A sorting domain-containing protein [Chitinophagaceae bacterium LB-8]|uniref:T9SS type A sorting domain-containing protein n=1 Tax=Paraflavisolibacter caeni TaxID=2982496 RepID=A0A9X3B7G6_9BACT|nr:T9SS type A sorting domain-containing protein [Paraflavisolibacter caeni]MCU7548466.1 T9SS type A sorting domain-containing protein [Paraflavisolibacter caeni]